MTAMPTLSAGPVPPTVGSAHVPAPSGTAVLEAPTVAVVGLGYVGLPTALALVASGCRVIGVDVSTERLDAIRRQDVDLLPSDRDRLGRTLGGPGLELTADPAAIASADTVMVCVPTPVDPHLVPDLRALSAACATVVAHAVPGQLLMLTSTTYVGTTRDLLVGPLGERGLRVGEDVHVAFSPERIDPGNAHHAQDSTPRVVGGVTARCTELAAEVLAHTAPSVHRVGSAEAAEMTKLFENTFRAVNIALANEFADNCRGLDLDPLEIIEAAASKPYGFMPFYPGPGVGGHCIPCDPHYLLWQLRRLRISSPLVDTAMTAIAGRPRQVVRRALELLADRGLPLAGARVLVSGIAYKPGVADVRESPALEIIEELAELGAEVAYADPLVPEARLHGTVRHSVADPGAQEWDLVIVHTVHPGTDLGWLTDRPSVLDATYRLTGLPSKAVL
ncbi:nucleotide sugar dehydrogenase [Kitasatospora sp. NPDC088346]|uniref:nucleotide sugar dehydrogenase n=1 Tax=Kitasatospora sp. NPDC088346 TaxID=3364073 RepID=UPI0037FA2EB0